MSKRMSSSNTTSRQIKRWIYTKLAKPNPKTGNFAICPYINKYKTQISVVHTDDPWVCVENFHVFSKTFGLEAVVCWGFDWTYEKLHSECNKINKKYSKKDILCLAMHPDTEDEPLPGNYTWRKCPLIIIQRISTLENARKQLKNTDYYQHYKD